MTPRNSSATLALSLMAILTLFTSIVSASRLQISNSERGFRIVWSPAKFEVESAEVRCNLTMEGTFQQRTFAKTSNLPIGKITRASLGACTGGVAMILTSTLPWNVQYRSFSGTLPSIQHLTVRFIDMSVNVRPTGLLDCLLRTSETEPALVDVGIEEPTGLIISFSFLAASEIPTTGTFCNIAPAHLGFIGTATVLGETSNSVIRLI